ncbi:acyltransferase family protein [Nocardioides sp. AX2bis]|uniref:acyltransferase family protein n=1 Tax=Nocardioides sp. AX2bis TaxID=2653157 RepID=UPI00135A43B1|nr:acyltransferase family protein [Nocardioides sp. AX2bis]
MRAVAVLAVVVAHAGVPFLPGGFVGVDVFFVVSGYLISGLLYRDLAAGRGVSLTRFWARRARRILPAATVVLLTTLLAGLAVLPLLDGRSLVEDALWAGLFVVNLHFARQDDYFFSRDVDASPLQHYWSLAVEEQFYVVWPLLLLGCLALVRAARSMRGSAGGLRPGRPLPRGAIAAMLVVLTAGSFAWSVLQTSGDAPAAYFSTLTRAWELGVGALAALVTARTTRHLTRTSASLLAGAGLLAGLLAVVLFSPGTPFPGYAAALPVLGTAAVLLAGAGRARPVTDLLLGNPFMRTVGDWSYSLYLWHWPALVLPEQALGRTLAPAETAGALVATVLLSAATFHLVETPFRTGRTAVRLQVRRGLILYPVSLVLVLGSSAGAWAWTESRFGESGDNPAITADPSGTSTEQVEALVQASVEAARDDVEVPSDLTPDLYALPESIADVGLCDYRTDVRDLCQRGDPTGDRSMVLVGDSHARAWIPAFDRIAQAAGWRMHYLVKSQCTAAHVVVAPIEEDTPFDECTDFHEWTQEQVGNLDPDLVVVASSPPVNGVFDESGTRLSEVDDIAPLLDAGYEDLFADLAGTAERTVLIRDVPKAAEAPGTCLSVENSLKRCTFEPQERSAYLADVSVEAAEDADVEVVDPTSWLCFEGDCPAVIGGTLSYRDSDHLTTEYSASLAEALGSALGMLED